MAMHSNIFAWKISWGEESGWLQSFQLQKVRHDSTHSKKKKKEKEKNKQDLQYVVVWSEQGVGFLSRKLGSEPYSASIFLGSAGKVSQHF